ncbi:MAG: flagellar M-ring protein FliF [Deltaproteobacteria bacterium]|nr:flagellar M-ring protein FliF [Deltaproteobacteria bacterium]
MNRFQALSNWFTSRSVMQRVGIISGAAVLAIGLTTALIVSMSTAFAPLYYNLASEDAAEVVDYLQRSRIPYRLADSGRTIKVARDDVYEVRLKLAGSQVMRGGVGFEIFDKTNLGVTEFVQNINFQRALQGELARTISEIKQIESTRVHLVLPQKALFSEDQEDATCSVIVKLRPGARLGSDQVQGIMSLVAGSVAGLAEDKVTVLDTLGTVLSKDLGKRPGQSEMTVNELKFRRSYESDLEERLQSMLERVVGRRKVVVRVSADLDFNKVEKTEEIFDPDQVAVRSERDFNEKNLNQEAAPGGVPGVASNLPDQANAAAAGEGRRQSGEKNEATRNYEISKLVSRTVMPVGAVKKVSVAVMVDGKYQGAEGEEKTYVARNQAELEIYTNMVKKAIGFNKKRGDQVEVASVAFNNDSLEQEVAELKKAGLYSMIFTGLKYLGMALAALFFYFKMLKPGLRQLGRGLSEGGRSPAAPGSESSRKLDEMADEIGERVEISRPRTVMDQISGFAAENPEEVAKVVKMWLKGQTA